MACSQSQRTVLANDMADTIQLVHITREHFEAVVDFSRQYFLQDEPLCRSIGLQWNPASESFVRHAINQEISVMAVDTSKDNKIVGVRAHRVVKRDEKDSWDPPEEQSTKKIFDFVDYAYKQFDPWSKFQEIDSLIDCKFLAVHRDYRGRNLSVRMMEFMFEFMRREKIPLVFVLVSGKFSRAVMEKLDFENVFEMSYEDYRVDGQRVFYPENIHKGFAILLKWV